MSWPFKVACFPNAQVSLSQRGLSQGMIQVPQPLALPSLKLTYCLHQPLASAPLLVLLASLAADHRFSFTPNLPAKIIPTKIA